MRLPFLSVLGLDASASERDIKRAYAVRLKAIDPAADPEGFARLRQAFEAARAWAASNAPVHVPEHAQAYEPAVQEQAPDSEQAWEGEPAIYPAPPAHVHVDVRPTPVPPRAVVASAEDTAATALASLQRALRDEPTTPAMTLLDRTVAFLGTHHVDARMIFESMLVDAIAAQRLPRRDTVFPVAVELFGWKHTGGLGHAREAWIERNLAAAAQWQTFPPKQRKALLAWLERAEREGTTLSRPVVLAWAGIIPVKPYVGEFIRLHVADATLAAWERAFIDLPPLVRGKQRERAWNPRGTTPSRTQTSPVPPRNAQPSWARRLWNATGGRFWWWLIAAKLILLAVQALR